MRILILGGTSFIGPHQVRYALDRGHEITLFNRGQTNTHLFPGVERLVGDRNGDLTSLEGRQWDVVIDNSATNPRWVELTAGLLKDACERYVFVSTRSVYADTSRVPMSTAAPVWTYDRAGVEPGAEQAPLRSQQGVGRAGGTRCVRRRPSTRVPSRPHHRPRGRHGPLYLLAGSRKSGWRGVGSG